MLSALRPRGRVLVWYSGDQVWHERLLVRAVSESLWFIATPDRDAYLERLVGGSRMDSPAKCVGVDDEGKPLEKIRGSVYRFKEEVTEKDWEKLRTASALVCGSAEARAMLLAGERMVDEDWSLQGERASWRLLVWMIAPSL